MYQNIDIINSYDPEYIVLLAGDHIYKMDYEQMLQQHVEQNADVTIGCIEVPRLDARGFGVVHVDANDRVIGFLEKPADPPGMPDKPDMAFASMGIYVFRTKFLFEELRRDAADEASDHDFGKDIIPYWSSTAALSRIASSVRVCGRPPTPKPIGATSVRSMPTGRRTST